MRLLRFEQAPVAAPPPLATTDGDIATALEDIARQIRSGELSPAHLVVHAAHGAGLHTYWSWRCSTYEHIGLLEVGKNSVLTQEVQP